MGEFIRSARKATTLFMKIKGRIKNTDEEILSVLLFGIIENLEGLKNNIGPYNDPLKENKVSDIFEFITEQQVLFDSIESDSDIRILSYYKNLELKLTEYVEELNKQDLKRVSLKSEFKKMYKDEKNAVKIKIDWTVTNYEMKTNHNIDTLTKDAFELGNNIDVIKSYVTSNIFCFDEFNEDLERMKISVEKKLNKFYGESYKKYRFASDISEDVPELETTIKDISMDQMKMFNSVELNIVLSTIFDKLSFFPFAKKKKMTQLEIELKRILGEYTDKVTAEVHKVLDSNSQVYYQSVFDNIDTTFDQNICKSDMTGYLIRSMNQCISTLKVPNMNYTVKDTILNQHQLTIQ